MLHKHNTQAQGNHTGGLANLDNPALVITNQAAEAVGFGRNWFSLVMRCGLHQHQTRIIAFNKPTWP